MGFFRRTAPPQELKPPVVEAFEELYPGLNSTVTRVQLGSDDLLVRAYPVLETHGSFWHYATDGLASLEENEKFFDPEIAGFGLEWTLRVAGNVMRDRPDEWPVELLALLSSYIAGGSAVEPEQWVILPEHFGDFTGVLFRLDPSFVIFDTDKGRMALLQAVCLTEEQVKRAQEIGGKKLLQELVEKDPLTIAR